MSEPFIPKPIIKSVENEGSIAEVEIKPQTYMDIGRKVTFEKAVVRETEAKIKQEVLEQQEIVKEENNLLVEIKGISVAIRNVFTKIDDMTAGLLIGLKTAGQGFVNNYYQKLFFKGFL